MDESKFQFQYAGLQWLKEMEIVDHPQFVNHLKLNILMVSKRIKEVELLVSRENKQILVYVDLTWLGRKFFKKTIFLETEDILAQLLPSFRFRVIDNPQLFNLAVEKIKKALSGGSSGVIQNSPNVVVSDPSNSYEQIPSVANINSGSGETQQVAPDGISSNSKEQSKT